MDPMTIAALVSGGMGLLNSGMGIFDQALAYQYQSALLKKQQDWQERMSNTAHQREVKDMRAAGLNPILSATGGSGASSPVVTAPSVNSAGLKDAFSNSAKSVAELKKAFDTEVKQADAEIKQVNANIENQEKITTATVNKLDSEAKYLDAQASRTRLGPVDIPGNFVNSVGSFIGKGVDSYLDHVGRPFSEWMNNSAKSVKDFFGSMRSTPQRGRDRVYPKGRVVTDDIEKGKHIYRVNYEHNYKEWRR